MCLFCAGKLRCSGKSSTSETLLSSCSSLKKSGLSSNGFYLTKVVITTLMIHVLVSMQDSPTDPVSVNYCQLSSPGYKEEELRRGDTEALGGGMDEFIIEDLTCDLCKPCDNTRDIYGRKVQSSNNCDNYYDIDLLTLKPNTSAHFNFEAKYLVVKSPGFYGISVSAQVQVYQGSDMILNDMSSSFPKHSFVRLDVGDKISMKTTYNKMDSTRGSKLFIALLK